MAAAVALLSSLSTSISLFYSRSLKKLWSLSFANWSGDAVTKCERRERYGNSVCSFLPAYSLFWELWPLFKLSQGAEFRFKNLIILLIPFFLSFLLIFLLTSFPYPKVIPFPRFVIVNPPQSKYLSPCISCTLLLGRDYIELSIPHGKSTPRSVSGIKPLYTSLAQRTYLWVPYFVTKAMLFPYTIQIGSYGLQKQHHYDRNSRDFPRV